MHIQIVNFELTALTKRSSAASATRSAPALAAVSWPHLEGKEGAAHPHPSPGQSFTGHSILSSACSSNPNMRRGVSGTPGESPLSRRTESCMSQNESRRRIPPLEAGAAAAQRFLRP